MHHIRSFFLTITKKSVRQGTRNLYKGPKVLQISMKVPKLKKRLCPYCKKHTEHKVAQNKKRTPSSLSYGSKYRARGRGQARGTGSRGKYSKPAMTKWKRTGAKTSKKTDFRYSCMECKKVHMQSSGIRAKKVELV